MKHNHKIIALLVAAGLILLGLYYFKRNDMRRPMAMETQVDTTQDVAPEVAGEQEVAQ